MSVDGMAMDDQSPDDEQSPDRDGRNLHRRKRVQNFVLLAVLVSFVVLVYFVSIVRMGAD